MFMLAAQPGEAEVFAALAALGAFLFVIVAVVLAIMAVVCWLLYTCFKRIPAQHREMDPGLVWLLMIPCFPLVWNFFVYPKLARSFQKYFAAAGVTDVGDCGASLAMAYAVCAACSIIPYLGGLAGLAAFVLLIINLVKFWGLKDRIPENAA